MFKVPEPYRIHDQIIVPGATHGNNGAFFIPREQTRKGKYYLCFASNGAGWEHVSVSIPAERRTPTWEEMCYIKSLFWEAEDTVIQIHPPHSQYVDLHPYCLHLWRPTKQEIPFPNPAARLWSVFDKKPFL